MLIIQADSIFKRNSDKKSEIVQEEELILYLNEEVILENVTFERLFKLILQHHSFFDIVFFRALGGFRISDYENDFLSTDVLNDFMNVNFLQLSWKPDLYEDNNVTNLSLTVDIAGKNVNDAEIGYSITLSPINEYKHLQLVINPNFKFYDVKEDKVILDVNRNMTLYDVIKVILYEITFYGPPHTRDVFKEEIINMSDSLDLDESIHTLSFDDLFQNVKDQISNDIKLV